MTLMSRIVVIEDDDTIRGALQRGLSKLGHEVDAEATGYGGLNQTIGTGPDVVVLDLGLPDIDGSDLLKMIRAVSRVPVIVGTAVDAEESIIATLDAGADDYVVKPFSAGQIDARIRAVLRRRTDLPEMDPIVIGDLVVDPAGRRASLAGQPLELSRKEFDLLYFLAGRVGRIVTKRQLLAEVWEQPYGGADKTVDVHLSWLRRKLGESGTNPRYLRSVRGVGVVLQSPDRP
jgi:DNA-binding response OmpR family regulator